MCSSARNIPSYFVGQIPFGWRTVVLKTNESALKSQLFWKYPKLSTPTSGSVFIWVLFVWSIWFIMTQSFHKLVVCAPTALKILWRVHSLRKYPGNEPFVVSDIKLGCCRNCDALWIRCWIRVVLFSKVLCLIAFLNQSGNIFLSEWVFS